LTIDNVTKIGRFLINSVYLITIFFIYENIDFSSDACLKPANKIILS